MPTKVPTPSPIAISFQQERYSRKLRPSPLMVNRPRIAPPIRRVFWRTAVNSTTFSSMAPMANMPTTSGMRWMPSPSHQRSKVLRGTELTGSAPMVPIKRPSAALNMPLAKCEPESAPSRQTASTISQNRSDGPNCSATSASRGAIRMVMTSDRKSAVTDE